MKGVVLRQLQQATGVATSAPGLVNRLLNAGADCRPAALFTDGGARGMATGADIMCGSSNDSSPKQEKQEKEAGNAAAGAEPGVSSTVSAAALEESSKVVVAMPASAKQKWWRPDPATGTWVPEGSEGQVTTTNSKSPSSRVTRIRSDTTASLEDKRWWTSMEELPDMDRANPK